MGKIKEGLGSLIGNAGEYYVVAELLKRGIIAALAPRNSPAFDILATKDDKTVRNRVKTKSEEMDPWQWSMNKKGYIFRDIHETEDFVVMVDLAQDTRNVHFYIIPTAVVNKILTDDFNEWLNTPGQNGWIRSKENPKRHLSYKKSSVIIQAYENKWDSLWY